MKNWVLIMAGKDFTRKEKIMVVDDEPYMVFLLKEIFIREGLKVFTSLNGQECLDQISIEQPDIILLDIMMPDMTGYQVCQKIKSNPLTENIPVVFISVKNEEMDIVRAIEMGGSDYFTKPITNSIVAAKVKQILIERRNNNEIKAEIKALEDIYTNLEAKYEKINLGGRGSDGGKSDDLSMMESIIPVIRESALIEYSHNDDLKKVVKSITENQVRNNKNVIVITSQPETDELYGFFREELDKEKLKLVDIVSNESKENSDDRYVKVYLSEIIHYGILWNYIPDDSVVIFTPLSKVLNKFGIRTTYNFLQKANETLGEKSSILITSINKTAHEQNLISGLETIFPRIFELKNEELKKIV